jgi:hypothetical protein
VRLETQIYNATSHTQPPTSDPQSLCSFSAIAPPVARSVCCPGFVVSPIPLITLAHPLISVSHLAGTSFTEQAKLTKTLASKPEDHNERVVALQKVQRAQAKDMAKLLQEVAKVCEGHALAATLLHYNLYNLAPFLPPPSALLPSLPLPRPPPHPPLFLPTPAQLSAAQVREEMLALPEGERVAIIHR